MVEFLSQHPHAPWMTHRYWAAAGILGFGIHNAERIAAIAPSALVTPSITLRGRSAPNTPVATLHEYRGGLIYTDPWHDPGVEWVGRRCTPVWANWEIPVFVSLAGDESDVVHAAQELDQVEGIAGFEVSITSSQTDLTTLLPQLRQRITLPLIVKLPTSDAHLLATQATVCAQQQIDAITLCAPQRVANGQLVHPAHIAQHLLLCHHLSQVSTLPLIGCGGIHDVASAQAYHEAGCTVLQIGSWLLRDAQAIHTLLQSPSP